MHPVARPKLGRHLPAHLVFEQLSLELGFELEPLLLVPRQQHDRLDVDEPGGHLEELAGDLEVLFLQRADMGQILLEQGGNLDVADVQLVLLDEEEQKVERAFKLLRFKQQFFHRHT